MLVCLRKKGILPHCGLEYTCKCPTFKFATLCNAFKIQSSIIEYSNCEILTISYLPPTNSMPCLLLTPQKDCKTTFQYYMICS